MNSDVQLWVDLVFSTMLATTLADLEERFRVGEWESGRAFSDEIEPPRRRPPA